MLTDCHAFEVSIMVFCRLYDRMAKKWIDRTGKMSHEDKKKHLVKLIRNVSWGEMYEQ